VRGSEPQPKPVACAPEALLACPPPSEAVPANLGEAEAIDAEDAGRWEQCVIQHNAALDCFRILRARGYVTWPEPAPSAPAAPQPRTRGERPERPQRPQRRD
jgi:hypothetical protein